MLNWIKKIMLTLVIFALLCRPAGASEVMEAGTVLTERSYVFSIAESKKLTSQIESLEEVIRLKDELLSVKNLINSENQIIIENRERQISEYQKINLIYTNRIKSLESRDKLSVLENAGWFAAGIGLTVGSIYLADHVVDDLNTSNKLTPGLINIKFK